MTPQLARANQKTIAIRRRGDVMIYKRRTVGLLETYLKKLLGGGRVQQRSIAAGIAPSWICSSSTSWTDVKIVEMTNSEICAAEFASWTIFDEDIGNDYFLGECMRLFNLWQWFLEEIFLEEFLEEFLDSDSDTYYGLESLAESKDTVMSSASDSKSWTLPLYDVSNDEDDEDSIEACGYCDRFVGERAIYTALFDEDDDEEVEVEPEPHDSLLMAALLSTKELLPAPSAGVVRALSCPDVLMTSLAALLFETRHLNYINERLSLPAPPKWMTALETIREMDPPNSLVSTVSLPSGWDAVSARLSSSSIFNLFSDRPASPIPSLFSIDPTGARSTTGSTVTGSVPQSSIVSIPSTFFGPREVTSSTSSMSSLFMDPSSAHSTFSIDPSGCSSTSFSSLPIETISSSSSLPTSSDCGSECVVCQTFDVYDSWPRLEDCGGMSRRVDRSEDDLLKTHTISGASSGYESEVDSEPVVLKREHSETRTEEEIDQRTLALLRMLAECDLMIMKLMIMQKKLREMM